MSRTPDFIVKALNKKTDAKNRIGAAWHDVDGRISIVLDDFIVIGGNKDLLITLFPNNKDAKNG